METSDEARRELAASTLFRGHGGVCHPSRLPVHCRCLLEGSRDWPTALHWRQNPRGPAHGTAEMDHRLGHGGTSGVCLPGRTKRSSVGAHEQRGFCVCDMGAAVGHHHHPIRVQIRPHPTTEEEKDRPLEEDRRAIREIVPECTVRVLCDVFPHPVRRTPQTGSGPRDHGPAARGGSGHRIRQDGHRWASRRQHICGASARQGPDGGR
mmetsp:Transcript_1223/g.2714  ORF Transcript_1223/g.2714 Transcript_1223/m.2714 type:complete len:208 (-) Transcript_1223:3034-3657(-)